MRFQVLSGEHHEGKEVYGPGSIVESDRDLAKLFVNKFRRLTDEPTPKKGKEKE